MISKADIQAYQSASPAEQRRIAGDLIKKNEPLIIRLVRKYSRCTPEDSHWQDLMQAGRIAFLKTLAGLDLNKGAFTTYYGFWVRDELSKITDRLTEIYRPAGTVMSRPAILTDQKILAQQGRPATAEELGVSEKKYVTWREQPLRVHNSKKDAASPTRSRDLARMGDDTGFVGPEDLWRVSTEETTEETIQNLEAKRETMQYLMTLSVRDLQILAALREGESPADVCREFGMNRKALQALLTRIRDARP